jgi:hypothetical protein
MTPKGHFEINWPLAAEAFTSGLRCLFDRIKLIFYPQIKNSTTHLILQVFPTEFGSVTTYVIDTVTDFLFELGMKPLMNLVEISIFSLNNATVRLTKIMNNLFKHLKILLFQVIFQCWKLARSFQKKFCEKYWTNFY